MLTIRTHGAWHDWAAVYLAPNVFDYTGNYKDTISAFSNVKAIISGLRFVLMYIWVSNMLSF